MSESKKTGTTTKHHVRPDGGDAFIRDPRGGPAHTRVDIAESLAEHYVSSATAAQDADDEDIDQAFPDDAFRIYVMASADSKAPRSSRLRRA